MQIAVISDTHMPRGGRRLPSGCVERLRAAEPILHAGDFVELSVLAELQSLGQVIAVHGNVDEASVRAALPAIRTVQAGGVSIGLVHDAGPARGRIERMRALFPEADAVVFGHSHIPLHERSAEGFQIFNPGGGSAESPLSTGAFVVQGALDQRVGELLGVRVMRDSPDMNVSTTATKSLRQRRLDARITLQRLAEEAGVSISMAQLIDRGYTPTRSPVRDRIVRALDDLEAEAAHFEEPEEAA